MSDFDPTNPTTSQTDAAATEKSSGAQGATTLEDGDKGIGRGVLVGLLVVGLTAAVMLAGVVCYTPPKVPEPVVASENKAATEKKKPASTTTDKKKPAETDKTKIEDDSTPTSDGTETATDTDPGSAETTPGGTGGGSGSGGGTTTPQKVWVDAWDEWVVSGYNETQYINHPAEYGERPVYGDRCNDCGYVTQGSIWPHMDSSGHHGYSTDVQIGTESYVIRDAWTETVQVWVDTSHNVHHEGYWR